MPSVHHLRPTTNILTASFAGLIVFSALINVLYLTGSFYMLQVYDRVIPSRSVPTLIALSLLALGLFASQAGLEFARARLLVRLSRFIDESFSTDVFALMTNRGQARDLDAAQPVRDLDQIRAFVAGAGPVGFLDAPWIPIYLGICFLLHSTLGAVITIGAAAMVGLTILMEAFTRMPLREAAAAGVARDRVAETARRHADVLSSMGMTRSFKARWTEISQRRLDAHIRASDIAALLGGVSRAARMTLQSGVLGVGALLVIRGEATGGVIIAGSILSARALAPVDHVLAHWKNFNSARQSWRRLREQVKALPREQPMVPLRHPQLVLTVESLSVAPPRAGRLALDNVSFELRGGVVLGILGASGSGKSTLARALVGLWSPARGAIRMDGAALEQWTPQARSRFIGYMPQEADLIDGTIAQNISRFDIDADPEAIIAAAELAGVHDMIVALPKGYQTPIGEGGHVLSGGQRQRICLARALYRDPFLVVLDEPNASLDADGEFALAAAIAVVRRRGGVVIVIAHKESVLESVDKLLVLSEGRVRLLGPRDQVLARLPGRVGPPPRRPAMAGAA